MHFFPSSSCGTSDAEAHAVPWSLSLTFTLVDVFSFILSVLFVPACDLGRVQYALLHDEAQSAEDRRQIAERQAGQAVVADFARAR